jgi:hypothetical protein
MPIQFFPSTKPTIEEIIAISVFMVFLIILDNFDYAGLICFISFFITSFIHKKFKRKKNE